MDNDPAHRQLLALIAARDAKASTPAPPASTPAPPASTPAPPASTPAPPAPRRVLVPEPYAPTADQLRQGLAKRWGFIAPEAASVGDCVHILDFMRLALKHDAKVEALRPLWQEAIERAAVGEPVGRELHEKAMRVIKE